MTAPTDPWARVSAREPRVAGPTRHAVHLEQVVAAAALVVLGLKFSFGPGLMPRHAAAFLLLPLWLVVLPRFRGARPLLGVSIAAAVAGLILAELATGRNAVSQAQGISTTLVLLGFATGVGVVCWSRLVLSPRLVGLFFGLGLVVNAVEGTGVLGVTNPLKFGWAVPIAVVLLALTIGTRLIVQLIVLVVLAGLSVISDARAMFAVCLLAALLVLWQLRPASISRRSSWLWTAAMIAALGSATYNLGTTLLVEGVLGEEAQQRSIEQLDTAGSLILGGRPELAATGALFVHRPWGFGAGVSVSHGDLLTAKAGMVAINYDPDNGYVENYMFGNDTIELHSSLGDLWASFGIVGIALALLVLWLIVRNVSQLIAHHEASALVLFLACWGLWNLLFSPFYSSVPTMMLIIGLILPMTAARAESQPRRPLSPALARRRARSDAVGDLRLRDAPTRG